MHLLFTYRDMKCHLPEAPQQPERIAAWITRVTSLVLSANATPINKMQVDGCAPWSLRTVVKTVLLHNYCSFKLPLSTVL